MCPTSTGSSSIRPSSRNAHKPKVVGRFSRDDFNDLGSLDAKGFRLYRHAENWKAYVVFQPGDPGGFEDAAVADVNGDGRDDIVLGGWSNRTIWAENPAGRGDDPYQTRWTVHEVDAGRFSHEVCAVDLDRDGRCDLITTSGVYFQGATADAWTFLDIGRSGQGNCWPDLLANGGRVPVVIALFSRDGKKPGRLVRDSRRSRRPPGRGALDHACHRRQSRGRPAQPGHDLHGVPRSAMSTATAGRTSSPPARGRGPTRWTTLVRSAMAWLWLQQFPACGFLFDRSLRLDSHLKRAFASRFPGSPIFSSTRWSGPMAPLGNAPKDLSADSLFRSLSGPFQE